MAISEPRTSSATTNRLTSGPVQFIQAPLWYGSERPGAELGPEAIVTEISEGLRWDERHDVRDRILSPLALSVPTVPNARGLLHRRDLTFLDPVTSLCRDLADAVERTIEGDALPVAIGGDHAIAIGSIAGAARTCERLGVLWIDTHPDINTPATSFSGHLHGMPMAVATGIAAADLPELCALGETIPAVRPEDVCYLGIRDIDMAERRLIRDYGIWTRTMEEWSDDGIAAGLHLALDHLTAQGVDAVHVSFDLDVLDPSVFAASSTTYPGGLTMREASQVVRLLGAWNGPIRSLDWVEFYPNMDDMMGNGLKIAGHLLLTTLGERMRIR
jgi:arginase